MELERPRSHAKRFLDEDSEDSESDAERPTPTRFFSRDDIEIGQEPGPGDDIPRLEQWACVNTVPPNLCPYRCPITYGVSILKGTVTGHPKKSDGDTIWTSPLLFQKKDLARTCSRWFRLGEPEKGYVEHMAKEGKGVWGAENGFHANPQHRFTPNETNGWSSTPVFNNN